MLSVGDVAMDFSVVAIWVVRLLLQRMRDTNVLYIEKAQVVPGADQQKKIKIMGSNIT